MTLVSAPTLVDDGWALLPSLLANSVLQRIRALSERLPAQRAVSGCERPNNTLVPLRWDDEIVAAALEAPGVVEAIAAATGNGDLRWTSAYLSVKERDAGALWWHTDWWCWDHPVTRRRAAAQVAVLCYLTDTTTDTGALRLLPGTHLRSIPLHGDLPAAYADPSTPDDASNPAMADHKAQVTVEARAGDAAILDYRLLHGTHPNRASRARTCLILNFAPDWAGLPADVQAHLARGLALPTDAERLSPALERLRHLLPPPADPSLPDLQLSREAPSHFTHDEQSPADGA